ncbi:MAG: excinuclease ABC subunit UvrA, partial [Methylococcales bacterium]|nr:excinuclease ABC subunit UvrA [Methylococcales bacterium]
HIEGLSPAISIEQKSTSHNPRSTVGTITEIYDYLRLLYARAGIPHCPEHHTSLEAQTISQMVDQVLNQATGERWMLLAPVVNQRKGEHVQLMEDLRAQGFIRARIDGEVYDLDEPPALDLKKKHSIEVIVDRFKIRDDISLRLSESFETALRIANGIAIAASMDSDQQILFSERYACSQCGYSISELEPRIFSFNNPKGACPECDGLGAKQTFDPELVIHNADISLSGGAIRGWDRRNAYYHQIICSLAEHYNFDTEIPFSKLPEKIKSIILYGSGSKKIAFQFITSAGVKQTRTHAFEGIIANMERRFHETDSQMVRDDLSKYLAKKTCEQCHGTRLNTAARNVFIDQKPLPDLTGLPIKQALEFFNKLDLPGHRGEIAEKINKEIQQRLEFLVNVGLDYLTLDRSADTLSGGEAQRIRLASQIGAGLVGVMYVLDEPSIGLHQRDNQRLLNTLFRLRDLGNTVIVVEHDEDAIMSAQYVVDIGPGAGIHGGEIVATGTPEDIKANKNSLTGQYLSGKQNIEIPKSLTAINKDKKITIHNAQGNNLQNVDISFPIGLLTCVTGVSGSGKSTLVNDTLYRHAARLINKASCIPAACDKVTGLEQIDKVVDIDQSPIGRTPRSNPATYTGIFTPVRELFAATPESRSRG